MATVITYSSPDNGVFTLGSTVAPTATQATKINLLTAVINMLDADTTGTLTHNWNLSTAELAALLPLIGWYMTGPGTAFPILSFALTNSIAVTVAKTSLVGTGGTFNVTLLRPNTLIR